MFEFEYAPLPDVDAYLRRIGVNERPAPTRENLDMLIFAHQCSVPFENLRRLSGEYNTLKPEDLFQQVVVNKRGGYCFELNGLFLTLLRALGYDAYSCMARIESGRTVLSPIMHRGTIVRMDGKLLYCDVGLGGLMASFAVEISPEKQTRGETYWVEDTEEGWKALCRSIGDGSEKEVMLIFGLQPSLDIDFEAIHYYTAKNPESVFVLGRRLYQRRKDGYVRLLGNDFITYINGEKQERVVDESEVPGILKEYFLL